MLREKEVGLMENGGVEGRGGCCDGECRCRGWKLSNPAIEEAARLLKLFFFIYMQKLCHGYQPIPVDIGK